MHILLFGKGGQVGWELQRSLASLGELIALDVDSRPQCGDFTRLDHIAQTVRDIRIIVINDGSTDNSLKIVQSYKDPRIKLINNDQNLGLIKSLNIGVSLIQSDYIIRMDSDDICLPNRIEVQLNFMDLHPEVGASGSHYFQLKEDKHFEIDLPISSEEIRSFLIFNCPLAHPTTIIRKQILDKYHIRYETGYLYSEDYYFLQVNEKIYALFL